MSGSQALVAPPSSRHGWEPRIAVIQPAGTSPRPSDVSIETPDHGAIYMSGVGGGDFSVYDFAQRFDVVHSTNTNPSGIGEEIGLGVRRQGFEFFGISALSTGGYYHATTAGTSDVAYAWTSDVAYNVASFEPPWLYNIALSNELKTLTDALPDSVLAAYSRAKIDMEAAEETLHAVDQAYRFSDRVARGKRPRVSISEDGVVTFQWRKPDRGVLLVFTGDGTVGCSVKQPGGLYSANNMSIGIEDRLLEGVLSAIDQFE
jgi:hypothetical protein